MAEEKAVAKEQEAPQEQEVAQEVKKEKGPSLFSKIGFLKIPIIFLLVAILAVGTALIVTKVAQGSAVTKKENAKAEKKNQLGKFITLDPFTVNLAGGQNYLQAAIAFEIDGKNTELETELKDRKPQINDTIITILSSKSIDDISSNQGREKLKAEIKKAVDSLLGYGKIERVYFTTFIMQ